MSSTASTKPYFIRAIYEWCVDQGLTPYLSVQVDARTVVPRQYVQDGQIVLNIDGGAVNQLHMGNDLITFQARFSGAVQALSIPIDNVAAIYARENGQGVAFEVGSVPAGEVGAAVESAAEPPPVAPARPHLTRIK